MIQKYRIQRQISKTILKAYNQVIHQLTRLYLAQLDMALTLHNSITTSQWLVIK
ncbi:Uncharacterised protein [Mycobacteroides abscessus subsp. abscessus]|nr:Uncharacterised protein [Mycobacteroides abscessus subsp. abscessus]